MKIRTELEYISAPTSQYLIDRMLVAVVLLAVLLPFARGLEEELPEPQVVRTIEDVLEENQRLKEEVKLLNDDHNITELYNMIMDLKITHGHDIDMINTQIDSLTVKDMSLEADIDKLDNEIDLVQNTVDSMTIAPIGSIMAWNPTMDPLPSGWVECDGKTIQEGIWKGKQTPNINGEEYFLRGTSSKDDALSTQEDQVKYLTYDDYLFIPWGCQNGYEEIKFNNDDKWGATCGDCGSADPVCKKSIHVGGTTGSETRPKNMKVVYIIKIK